MTTALYVSPSERPPVSQLGTVSSICERLGSDILWESKHGMVGVQRKAVPDLIASVRDGRLGKELVQQQTLHTAFLVIEGQPAWDREGNLVSQHTRWNLRQHNGVILSALKQGVLVLTSRNPLETCSLVEYLVEWSDKDEHVSSLLSRNVQSKNGWGRMDSRVFAVSFLSGLPSISIELAGRIFDRFGNIVDASNRPTHCASLMQQTNDSNIFIG